MSSLPATVADLCKYVVDTHAAPHSYAIVAAPGGALLDQATFPTTPAGLRWAMSSMRPAIGSSRRRRRDVSVAGARPTPSTRCSLRG